MEIRDFPALAHLNDTQIENLRAVCDETLLAPGQELMQRGTEGGKLYFLLDGAVQVYIEENGSEVTLAEIPAPAILGEIELLTGGSRTASVRAIREGRALSVDHERVLARVEDGDPAVLKVMFGIARVIASRLVAISDKLVEVEAKDTPVPSRELREFRQKLFSEWSV